MQPGRSAAGAMPPLTGRDDLLAELRALLADGGVVLSGPAGVGTTRLMHELVEPGDLRLRATASAATVPLGVFLGVLAEHGAGLGTPDAPLGPLADARSATGPDASRHLVAVAESVRVAVEHSDARLIAVDDAHLLDPASAALLLELATAGARVVATVREGAPVPDAVRALWHDGLATLARVPPLDEDASIALLGAVAGAPVDHGLGRAVFSRCGGVPGLLCRAMPLAIESGAAVQLSGLWVLDAPLPAMGAQDGDVGSALDAEGLDPDARHAVELLSVGGRIPLDQAVDLVPSEALERAEAAGLVRVAGDGASATVAVATPRIADTVLARLGMLARRRMLHDLRRSTEARSTHRERDDSERVALCRWALEAGEPPPVDELLAVAEAVYVPDPLLCAALIRAALAADRSPEQSLRLANLLAHLHRMDEAEAVLEGIPADAVPGARALVPATRAYLLTMVAHEPARAIALLDGVEPQLASDPLIVAARTNALWGLGDFDAAVRVGEPLADDLEAPPAARAQAAAMLALVHISRADRAAYDRMRAIVSDLLPRAGAGMPELEVTRALQDVLALLNVDRDLAGAMRQARAGYDSALARADDSQRTEFAHLLAWGHVLGGDLASAMPLFRESLASRGMWSRTTRPWIETHYLRALVLTGAVAEARSVMERVLASPHSPVHDVSIALAEAALLAADGAVAAAGRRCEREGDRVRALGQFERALAAWFSGLRYGDDGCALRLLSRADDAPGSVTPAAVLQARSWLARDPDGLEESARAFADRGLLWFAVDAQSQSVELRTGRGEDPLPAAARLTVLRELAPGFGGAVSRTLPGHPSLTGREREVALLAARGASDREISAMLAISVRTVNAHLRNVYAKLGVHTRSALRHLLGV